MVSKGAGLKALGKLTGCNDIYSFHLVTTLEKSPKVFKSERQIFEFGLRRALDRSLLSLGWDFCEHGNIFRPY
eukprot:1341164-Amorphochlora_amoeboformis.AAC.1